MVNKISTDVPGLDEILGGGLPRPAAVTLIGEVGSGKSLLARQISWSLLKQGFHVLYYSVDECADDVRDGMRIFGWDITRFEEEDRFHFVDVFSVGTEVLMARPEAHPDEYLDSVFNFTKLLEEGQDLCLRAMAGKDLLVVLDSSSPMLTLMDTKEVFKFLQAMKFITRASQSIGIAIMHLGVHDQKTEESCKQMADTIIELRRIVEGQKIRRYIRVVKTMGNFYDEPCPIEIRENVGIVVHKIRIP